MSVIFVVTPIIMGGWPVLASAAAAAAGALGYKKLEKYVAAAQRVEEAAGVQLDVENIESIAKGVRSDDSITFGNEELQITVRKDARGQCTVHVDGKGKTEEELKKAGQQLIQRIMQQYAYQKVTSELQKSGFSIVQEEMTETQTIRIRFRKFD